METRAKPSDISPGHNVGSSTRECQLVLDHITKAVSLTKACEKVSLFPSTCLSRLGWKSS